jgi:hypothetical protein
MKVASSEQILENIQISIFIIIHPEGAELFHADGGTNRHDEAKGVCEMQHFYNFHFHRMLTFSCITRICYLKGMRHFCVL